MLHRFRGGFARQCRIISTNKITLTSGALLLLSSAGVLIGQSLPHDPGVRNVNAAVDAGKELPSVKGDNNLDPYFVDGKDRFAEGRRNGRATQRPGTALQQHQLQELSRATRFRRQQPKHERVPLPER
jgi:hypothetical protein